MSEVSVEVDGPVAVMRLQRPEKRNVLNSVFIGQAADAVARLAAMDGVAVAVLTGEGPSFCAGADVRELHELTSVTAASFIASLHALFAAIRSAPQIYIAAINGYALGAGCELVAVCDLRVAAQDAAFGMPEIRVGIPSVIEAALLVQLIGLGRTAEMVYTGENLTAAEAKAAGLVNRVVPAERLLDESLALARQLGSFSHSALRLQKDLVRAWTRVPLDRAVALGVERFAAAFTGPEPYEAMSAFFERRPPNFRRG